MDTTPNGTTIRAIRPDGSYVDITEGVQALYDLVIGSMDWGSGFWTIEDAAPVGEIARACGFKSIEEVDRYVLERRREDRRTELCRRGVAFQEAYAQVKREFPDPA